MNFTHALITGASSGIGAALARQLSAVVPEVTACGRDIQRLDEVPATRRLVADLAVLSDRARVIEMIQQTVPDLVINCAGIGLYGAAISHDLAKQMEILEVNAVAVAAMTLAAASALSEADQRGVILNVSSVGAFVPLPYSALYGASKSLVLALSRNLNLELHPRVCVLAACPGVVVTPFRERAAGGRLQPRRRSGMSADYAAKQILKQIQNRQPIRVFGWRARAYLALTRIFPDTWTGALVRNHIQKRYLR